MACACKVYRTGAREDNLVDAPMRYGFIDLLKSVCNREHCAIAALSVYGTLYHMGYGELPTSSSSTVNA